MTIGSPQDLLPGVGSEDGPGPVAPAPPESNRQVADRLEEMAELLTRQDGNPFRARAYRRAAETVRALPDDVTSLAVSRGIPWLQSLPNIGHSIATAVLELSTTGRWSHLQRMRRSMNPEAVFRSLPGIGASLARRLHEVLDVSSLEDLEAATVDGRLERVPGFGARRAALLRSTLAERLRRVRRQHEHAGAEPTVETLLEVDRDYRRAAEAGSLRCIAPRRFNPERRAWLPILRTRRGRYSFTVLFSNTANAHQADRVRDWVVIYFNDGDGGSGQRTVVTETTGPLAGQRVVRGRESECLRLLDKGG